MAVSNFLKWLAVLTAAKHAGEWISGLTGALGAILGSLVTITWTAWYSERTRLRERREKFAAAAFSSYQRLNQIYSISLTILNHHRSILSTPVDADKPPLCASIMPMLRMSGPVFFPIEELWALTQLGGKDLVNSVSSVDHAFNSLQDAVDTYRVEREKIWDRFPAPEEIEGIQGTLYFSEEQMKSLAPGFAALDHALRQIASIANSVTTSSFDALGALVHTPSKPLGKEFSIRLPLPSEGGALVEIRASDAPKKPHWWGRTNAAFKKRLDASRALKR